MRKHLWEPSMFCSLTFPLRQGRQCTPPPGSASALQLFRLGSGGPGEGYRTQRRGLSRYALDSGYSYIIAVGARRLGRRRRGRAGQLLLEREPRRPDHSTFLYTEGPRSATWLRLRCRPSLTQHAWRVWAPGRLSRLPSPRPYSGVPEALRLKASNLCTGFPPD